jgi:hypothetical protein
MLMPLITMSNFSAAMSVVKFAQMVGTNSIGCGSESEFDSARARSISAPISVALMDGVAGRVVQLVLWILRLNIT